MKKWLFIVLGTLFMAVGLNGFLAPHNLVTGGAAGISLMALRLFNIPMWFTNIVINIPLLIAAIKLKGWKFTKDTLYSTLLLSLFIGVTEFLPYFKTDIVLGSIYGGIISGVGLGLVFRANATTGGSDLAAGLIRLGFPYVSTARIMFIIDVSVIFLGFFVLGPVSALYAIIAVYIISKITDIVLEGLDFAKAAFIISDKGAEIGQRITMDLKRGATLFKGVGMYSNSSKNMIIVVMASKQIGKMREITKSVDDKAFVFISDVKEIVGEFRRV